MDVEITADIKTAAATALAPLFADPWIPPFMRDVGKVFEAAAVCPTFEGIDPARACGALRAAARLHPELRVPGALFFMGKLGALFLDPASRSWSGGYVQAPAPMAWPTWFCAELPEHPFALAQILDDFAWRAAAALLPPRSAAHVASLGTHSLFPGLSSPKAIDHGSLNESRFGEEAVGSFDIFEELPLGLKKAAKFDDAEKKKRRGNFGKSIINSLSVRYGHVNSRWIAASAQGDLSGGFDETLAKGVASGAVDPWSASSVMASFYGHASRAADRDCCASGGELYCSPEVLFELGPARSSRMLFAARASRPAPVRESDDLPDWLRVPAERTAVKPREAPGYPDIYFGKRAETFRYGTGDGIAAVLREHSVPGVFRARAARTVYCDGEKSTWRFAGAWRRAAKALGWEWDRGAKDDKEGFVRETLAFGAACAAIVRADFLAEWYGKCAVIPGRLFVASLAVTLAEWAKDGRLFGAAAGAAKDFFGGGDEDPVGRLRSEGGTRRGRLGKESVMGYAFTAKSAAAATAVRISALIGSGSARDEDSEAKVNDNDFNLDWWAMWDPELDAGIAELAEAAGSEAKRAALAAEAMGQRRIAFPDVMPADADVRAAFSAALSKAGYRDAREEELRSLAADAARLLSDDADRFAKMALSSPGEIRTRAGKAPEGRHAGVWAVEQMVSEAAAAKSRRAANAAASMGVEGRKLAAKGDAGQY